MFFCSFLFETLLVEYVAGVLFILTDGPFDEIDFLLVSSLFPDTLPAVVLAIFVDVTVIASLAYPSVFGAAFTCTVPSCCCCCCMATIELIVCSNCPLESMTVRDIEFYLCRSTMNVSTLDVRTHPKWFSMNLFSDCSHRRQCPYFVYHHSREMCSRNERRRQ
jgi:hypothetical protein